MEREACGGKHEVVFSPVYRKVMARIDTTLLEAALMGGLLLDAPCGGEGTCGKCRVRVEGAASDPTGTELRVLEKTEIDEGWRLACQATVKGQCKIMIPREALWGEAKAALLAEHPPSIKTAPSAGDEYVEGEALLGVALDLGTTTVSASVIDLNTAERLGAAATENPQVSFGADVMTRIASCAKDKNLIVRMKELAVSTCNNLIGKICEECDVNASFIYRAVLVGNPTMTHLFMGEDPAPIGNAPFIPPIRESLEMDGAALGIDISPGSKIFIPGPLSGFLGADLIAVMLATGILEAEGFIMAVDLGTNGEMVLGTNESFMACSTAAGPAFEGRQISCGMRAEPGAIESMSRDNKLLPRVIGGGKPRGICGSGLLDTIAALKKAGLLEKSGRLVSPENAKEELRFRIRDFDGGRAFVLDPSDQLLLTQSDIREFQLAKGAVAAGVRLLMENFEIDPPQIENVYLAGAFGNFLRPTSAIEVGIFPAELEPRIEFAGNAAILGAEMMLLSRDLRDTAGELKEKARVLELAGNPEFEREFLSNLSLG